MPKIAPSAAAARRANVLEAARHCFALHGIHASVDEICAKAGISKGAFYGYFDSKDDAIQALAEDNMRIVHEFTELDSLESFTRRIEELTTARSVASNRLELEAWTHALKLPSLRNALWRNIDGLRDYFAAGVGKLGKRSGDRRMPMSDRAAAEILSIFSLGLVAWSALGADRGAGSGNTALRKLLGVLAGDSPAPRRRKRQSAKASGARQSG